MMNISAATPFGVVVERDSPSCYRASALYQVYLDGVYCGEDDRNLLSLFGLRPGTAYTLELRFPQGSECCEFRTEDAGFVLNAQEYGAAGDGVHSDTAAVNAAIYTAPAGSVVRFPRGRYLVEQVLLKSGVDLYLEEGAVLLHNPDRAALAVLRGYQKDYHHTGVTVNASWEGNPLDCFCSLLYGKDARSVRIYGSGILDGNGSAGDWWRYPKEKRGAFRPRNIFLNHCSDISVMGLTSRNSAAWNIHPFYSDNLKFYGLRVESDPASPNTDGLNPESCENVEIAGCHFRVGDDCVAIKAGKYYMSRYHRRPCRGIAIRGCLMEEGHGGVVIGSEMSCGVENVTVERCRFERTDRGLRVKTRRGRGETAVVDGVRFSCVELHGVRHCFVVNMFYNCDPDGHSYYVRCKEPLPVDEATPAVRNITLCDVKADEISGSCAFLYGLPEQPIENVRIADSVFSYLPDRGAECPAMMDDAVAIPELGIFAENVTGLRLENNRFSGPHTDQIRSTEDNNG